MLPMDGHVMVLFAFGEAEVDAVVFTFAEVVLVTLAVLIDLDGTAAGLLLELYVL